VPRSFVSFVAGSFAAVLILASVLDPDLFLNFEVTSHRTVLFYITFFGTVVAGARALVPDEHRVFDAGALLQELATHTHYLPEPWRAAPHARAAHAAFGKLFVPKPALYVQELAGVLLTPFVLWLALPRCAPALVDFFREFTVHVDGLGYVCSFAVFDFTRHGNVKVRCTAPGYVYMAADNGHVVWRAGPGSGRAAGVE
jgi:autophagy-related protein 9